MMNRIDDANINYDGDQISPLKGEGQDGEDRGVGGPDQCNESNVWLDGGLTNMIGWFKLMVNFHKIMNHNVR